MLSRFDTVPACDRRTDGQTDGQTDRQTDVQPISIMSFSIADAHKKLAHQTVNVITEKSHSQGTHSLSTVAATHTAAYTILTLYPLPLPYFTYLGPIIHLVEH